MPRYIAFLRALNVGNHVVKMERLRSVFEDLGYARVESFIASGNIIFESSSQNEEAQRKKIENRLEEGLGYKVETFLRTDAELQAIANHSAFGSFGNGNVYIAFLEARPSRKIEAMLLEQKGEVDDFAFHGRELYWLCRENFSDSKFSGSRLEKMLQIRTTVRNSTTVKKLAAKYAPRNAA